MGIKIAIRAFMFTPRNMDIQAQRNIWQGVQANYSYVGYCARRLISRCARTARLLGLPRSIIIFGWAAS